MDNSSPNDIVNYLCNRYYALVDHLETLEERHKVRMDFANCLQSLSLGDVVNINDGIYDNYVITRLHGTFAYSESSDSGNSHDTSFHKAEAVPVLANKPDERGVVASIVDDLPRVVTPPKAYISSGTGPVAAVSNGGVSNGGASNGGVSNGGVSHGSESLLLEGTVTDNADPQKMNRVKASYTFQSKQNDTPWIPVMVPFSGTGDGGGVTMTLEKGERVLIMIVNNTPKYVMGAIYTDTNLPDLGYKDNVPATYKVGRKIRTIASGNGHALTFLDKPDSSLLFSKLPVFKTVLSCMRLHGKDNWMTKAGNVKGGGVILSDGSCLCTVELNADKQAIDIHSDFGTVGISAFTGITVNAPNGDITIKGKNVSIEAGNNLSLRAGTNIKNKSFSESLKSGIGLGMGMALSGMVTSYLSSVHGVDLTNLFDVSYLRSIYEIFMRPVEGTLSISSNRNILMTAGNGKVTIPTSLLSLVNFTNNFTGDKDGSKDWAKFLSDGTLNYRDELMVRIQNAVSEVDAYRRSIEEQHWTIRQNFDQFVELFDELGCRNLKKNARKTLKSSLKSGVKEEISEFFDIKKEDEYSLEQQVWYNRYQEMLGSFEKQVSKYRDDLTGYGALENKLKNQKILTKGLGKIPVSLFTRIKINENTSYDNLMMDLNLMLDYDAKILKRAVVVAILKSSELVIVNDDFNEDKEEEEDEYAININPAAVTGKEALDLYVSPSDNSHSWETLCDALHWKEPKNKGLGNFLSGGSTGSSFANGLLGGLAAPFGIASYDSATDKIKPSNSMFKLFNANGIAGPRGYETMSDAKGNILISNASSKSLSLKDDTTGWTYHQNMKEKTSLCEFIKSLHLE